jgi:hypothetical protein
VHLRSEQGAQHVDGLFDGSVEAIALGGHDGHRRGGRRAMEQMTVDGANHLLPLTHPAELADLVTSGRVVAEGLFQRA